MENRGPLRILAGTMPGQPHQWRQSTEPRNAACSQPGCDGTADSSYHALEKSHLPGCTIPAIANQTGRSESHHRHGSPACPIGLQNAEVWTTVHRQRRRVLRTEKPPTTNRFRQKESGSTRTHGHGCLPLTPGAPEVSGEKEGAGACRGCDESMEIESKHACNQLFS